MLDDGSLSPIALRKTVTVVTEMDPWSASTRYRALQYLPWLKERFASVKVSYPGDTVVRPPGRAGQLTYFATHLARYTRRTVELRATVADADALLVQRGLYPLGPGVIVRAIHRFPGRIVFDLDDAVFRVSPKLASKGQVARWLYGPQQALALLRRADEIVVSTQALAELLPTGLGEPTIIPTVPNPADYAVVAHDDVRPARVGWAGTVGGLSYLDPLAGVFGRLADEGLAVLEVVCSEPWNGPSIFHRWSLPDEISVFSRFSVGIMPLPDTAYTRAKAGFKLLQYMAAGLPVIASPIGINAELVNSSGAGYLADRPDEWEEALRLLADDPELRSKLGRAGREFVQQTANLAANADTLTRLLSGA